MNTVTGNCVTSHLGSFLMGGNMGDTVVGLNNGILYVNSGPSNAPFGMNVRGPFTSHGRARTIVSVTKGSIMSSKVCREYFGRNNGLCRRVLGPRANCPCSGNLVSIAVVSSRSISNSTLDAAYFTLNLGSKLGFTRGGNIRTIFVARSCRLRCASKFRSRVGIASIRS